MGHGISLQLPFSPHKLLPNSIVITAMVIEILITKTIRIAYILVFIVTKTTIALLNTLLLFASNLAISANILFSLTCFSPSIGVAQVTAQAGYNVLAIEAQPEALAAGMKRFNDQ